MSAIFLLDTNTASYIIKGVFPSVRRRLLKTPMEQICISSITQAELLYGVARKPELSELKKAVGEFLLRLNILSWDAEAAAQYANLRADLEKRGKSMGNLDMMIAAHALSVNATLVTNDQAFRHVDNLKHTNWCK